MGSPEEIANIDAFMGSQEQRLNDLRVPKSIQKDIRKEVGEMVRQHTGLQGNLTPNGFNHIIAYIMEGHTELGEGNNIHKKYPTLARYFKNVRKTLSYIPSEVVLDQMWSAKDENEYRKAVESDAYKADFWKNSIRSTKVEEFMTSYDKTFESRKVPETVEDLIRKELEVIIDTYIKEHLGIHVTLENVANMLQMRDHAWIMYAETKELQCKNLLRFHKIVFDTGLYIPSDELLNKLWSTVSKEQEESDQRYENEKKLLKLTGDIYNRDHEQHFRKWVNTIKSEELKGDPQELQKKFTEYKDSLLRNLLNANKSSVEE